MAMARQVARPVQDSPGGLLMSLFGDDPSLFADPFAAVLPFAAGSSRIAPGRHRAMALDVLENDKTIEVLADIPGVKKEDIHLEVDDNIMSLSVDTKHESEEGKKEDDGVTWHRVERSHYFCKRSVRLPDYADTSNVAAAYENGVLKVTVPKKEVKEDKQKITIS